METIILSGGLGTRLRSVVNDKPKCMADIDGKPFLYYWLKYLEKFTITDKIIFSLGYKAEYVLDWIEKEKKNFFCQTDYIVEKQPLGTGGAIGFALKKTKSKDILVLNGDSLFLADLNDLYFHYCNTDSDIVMALKPMKNFERYGKVNLGADNIVTSFEEKKYCSEGFINAGVYMFDKHRLSLEQYGEKFSFEKQVLETKKNIRAYAYNSYFIDIGIPEDYLRAQKELPLQF